MRVLPRRYSVNILPRWYPHQTCTDKTRISEWETKLRIPAFVSVWKKLRRVGPTAVAPHADTTSASPAVHHRLLLFRQRFPGRASTLFYLVKIYVWPATMGINMFPNFSITISLYLMTWRNINKHNKLYLWEHHNHLISYFTFNSFLNATIVWPLTTVTLCH